MLLSLLILSHRCQATEGGGVGGCFFFPLIKSTSTSLIWPSSSTQSILNLTFVSYFKVMPSIAFSSNTADRLGGFDLISKSKKKSIRLEIIAWETTDVPWALSQPNQSVNGWLQRQCDNLCSRVIIAKHVVWHLLYSLLIHQIAVYALWHKKIYSLQHTEGVTF